MHCILHLWHRPSLPPDPTLLHKSASACSRLGVSSPSLAPCTPLGAGMLPCVCPGQPPRLPTNKSLSSYSREFPSALLYMLRRNALLCVEDNSLCTKPPHLKPLFARSPRRRFVQTLVHKPRLPVLPVANHVAAKRPLTHL